MSLVNRIFELAEAPLTLACETLSRLLPHTIKTDEKSPYLGRYYLLRRRWLPKMVRDRAHSVYLHYFYRGDSDIELHNHPWGVSISLILTGGYVEERRTDHGVVTRRIRPGSINIIRAHDFHRVTLLKPAKGSWTLFVAGPRTQDWGFWHPGTGVYTDQQTFIDQRARAASEPYVLRRGPYGSVHPFLWLDSSRLRTMFNIVPDEVEA